MFSLRNWFSRPQESAPRAAAPRTAAVEPLEGRQLMSVSTLPAVQHSSIYSLGGNNTVPVSAGVSPTSTTGSTNIIAVLVGM